MESVAKLYGSERPKIWLRREPDIMSRGTKDEMRALANLEALYAGQPGG